MHDVFIPGTYFAYIFNDTINSYLGTFYFS